MFISKIKNVFVFSLLASSLVFADDHVFSFVGLYGYENTQSGNKEVLEIVHNEDGYFVRDALGKYYLLEVISDGLVFMGNTMTLSEDKQTMTFSGLEYPRVSGKTIEQQLAELSSNDQLCKSLDEEAAMKSAIHLDADSWNRYVDELQKRRPSGCILVKEGKRLGFDPAPTASDINY